MKSMPGSRIVYCARNIFAETARPPLFSYKQRSRAMTARDHYYAASVRKRSSGPHIYIKNLVSLTIYDTNVSRASRKVILAAGADVSVPAPS